jgi:chaperonin GroES
MSVNIQPRPGYLVVQPDKAQLKTASGILLGQGAQEKPETATVIAIGKDVKDLKVGERVLFIDEYGKTKTVTIDKEDYAVIKEEHVIATVK